MDVSSSAMIAMRDCMGVRPEERVMIVTDTVRRDIGEPLFHAALGLGCDAILLEMRPRERSGEEPPKSVAHAMLHADVVVAATKMSMTHTQAVKDTWRGGARVASIPIQSDDHALVTRVFGTGGMTADYMAMARQIDRLLARLGKARKVRVTTELGTDITFSFGNREWHADKGLALEPGSHTNLPGGEIFIAPDNADGIVIIDGSFGDYGLLEYPLELRIKDGFCVAAEGDHAMDLNAIFSQLGHNARNLAELGIGMNPKAKPCGIVLEDEKAGNTIHVALGNNTGFGGDVSVPMHYDGIVTRPTLYADGERLDLSEYLQAPGTISARLR
ncbi:MAG: aminopeptidase [Methanocella sp.]